MTSWQKAKETTDQKVRSSNLFGRTAEFPYRSPRFVVKGLAPDFTGDTMLSHTLSHPLSHCSQLHQNFLNFGADTRPVDLNLTRVISPSLGDASFSQRIAPLRDMSILRS